MTVCKIIGRVQDPNGKPLAKADIWLKQRTRSGYRRLGREQSWHITTGADGSFAHDWQPGPSLYSALTAIAWKEGFGCRSRTIHKFGYIDEPAHSLVLQLGEPATLVGKVIDESKKGLSGARVWAWQSDCDPMDLDFFSARSEAKGSFRIPNLPIDGRVVVAASVPGRPTTFTSNFIAGQYPPTVGLAAEGRITGQVVEHITGKGVAGITLRVSRGYWARFAEDPGAMSDKDGRFTIGDLTEGEYCPAIFDASPATQAWVSKCCTIKLKAGQAASDVKVELFPAGIIEVRTADKATARPIAGVMLRLTGLAGSDRSNIWESTDANGLARIPVWPSKYRIVAVRQGYKAAAGDLANVGVRAGQTVRLTAALTALPSAEVLPAGLRYRIRVLAMRELGEWPPQVKPQATKELKSYGHDCVRVLADMLQEPTAAARAGAAKALGIVAIDPAESAKMLAGALDDEGTWVRAESAGGLVKLGHIPPGTLPRLMVLARKKHTGYDTYDERKAVFAAIAKFAPNDANMAKFLAESPGCPLDQLAALGPAAAPAVGRLIDCLRKADDLSADAYMRVLVGIGPAAVGPMQQALADSPPAIQAHIAYALADMKCLPEGAVGILTILLHDEHKEVRRMVAYSLEKMGPLAKPAMNALVDCLDDQRTCGPAADALAAIGRVEPKVLDGLSRIMAGYENAYAAAAAMGKLAPASVPTLLKLAAGKDARLRMRALAGLGKALPKSGDKRGEVVDALLLALKDRDPKIRTEAAVALRDADNLPPQAEPALVAALSDSEEDVRSRAASALARKGPEGVVLVLCELKAKGPAATDTLSPCFWELKVDQAAPLTADLVRLLKDRRPAVVLEAIRSLRYVANPRQYEGNRVYADKAENLKYQTEKSKALAAVRARLAVAGAEKAICDVIDDANTTVKVRVAAIRLLGEMDPAKATAELALCDVIADGKSPAEVRTEAFQLLGKIGPTATGVAMLKPLLADPNSDVRASAAAALATARDPNLAPEIAAALAGLLKDPNSRVVFHAMESLASLRPVTDQAVAAMTELLSDKKSFHISGDPVRALLSMGPAARSALPKFRKWLYISQPFADSFEYGYIDLGWIKRIENKQECGMAWDDERWVDVDKDAAIRPEAAKSD